MATDTGNIAAKVQTPMEEKVNDIDEHHKAADGGEGMYADNEKLKDLIKSEKLQENRQRTGSFLGAASDDIKLTTGSVIEISRLMMDGVVSRVENELCRAFIQMYLGDDPFDMDAKEKFGISFLSLF
ncbi:hypothetical protein OIU85_002046 [Salix viminalis]|uniref:Uncharacterized protein n=1 Tax=Salix viminalis TaxID=40686 RepID=A0A9Q0ZYL6_SALVM|nr:hypothetical protein OIU85_002046 [Salix viminalis]